MHNVIKNTDAVNITEYIYDDSFEFEEEKPTIQHSRNGEIVIRPIDLPFGGSEVDEEDVDEATQKANLILNRARELAAEIEEEASLKAKKYLDDAIRESGKIERETKAKALKEADEIREKAYNEAYNEGFSMATEKAFDEMDSKYQQMSAQLLESVGKDIEEINKSREILINDQLNDLTQLVLTISSKVINVSLKSSADVIERMIISATEKSKNSRWIKIFISEKDAGVVLKSEQKIIDHLRNVSGSVKFEIMENKPSGTCIVEFPDKIIDAGVDTQLENIQNMVKNF